MARQRRDEQKYHVLKGCAILKNNVPEKKTATKAGMGQTLTFNFAATKAWWHILQIQFYSFIKNVYASYWLYSTSVFI